MSQKLEYQHSDALSNINGFPPEFSSTIVMFKIEPLMEEFELMMAGESKFDN